MILIIDDQVDLCEILCEAFEDEGFVPKSANSSAEAFKQIEENNFQAIVCDQNLGEVTKGTDIFTKFLEVKSDALFYLSTGEDQEQFEYLLSKGLSGIFCKPYDVFNCVEIIQDDLNK